MTNSQYLKARIAARKIASANLPAHLTTEGLLRTKFRGQNVSDETIKRMAKVSDRLEDEALALWDAAYND